MASSIGRRRRRRAWLAGLSVVGFLALGTGIGATAAAWVDEAYYGGDAQASSFDVWARFSDVADWEDVGLPGDPDTFLIPIDIGTVTDALPGSDYAFAVFLCNAGELDGHITAFDAVLDESSGDPGDRIIELHPDLVDGINVGDLLPAGGCPADPVNPVDGDGNSIPTDYPDDVQGIIHFTTIDDFTGLYGETTTVTLRVTLSTEPV